MKARRRRRAGRRARRAVRARSRTRRTRETSRSTAGCGVDSGRASRAKARRARPHALDGALSRRLRARGRRHAARRPVPGSGAACTGRVVVGQQLLDHGVTHGDGGADRCRAARRVDLPGRRLPEARRTLALRWARARRASRRPRDGRQGAPRLRARGGDGRVRSRRGADRGRARSRKAPARCTSASPRAPSSTFDNRVVQWVSDKIGGDKLATPARPPPDRRRRSSRRSPLRRRSTLAGGQQLQFTYCDGPVEIAEGAYGALPFAVALLRHDVAHVPRRDRRARDRATDRSRSTSTSTRSTRCSTSCGAPAGSTAGSPRPASIARFNTDPTVTEFLSVRISPPHARAAPVVTPAGGSKLRLAADARDRDRRRRPRARIGHVYGALDSLRDRPTGDRPRRARALLRARPQRRSCPVTAISSRPCATAAPTFTARSRRSSRAWSRRSSPTVRSRGLPADLTIQRAEPSVTAGTLHLKLDAKHPLTYTRA